MPLGKESSGCRGGSCRPWRVMKTREASCRNDQSQRLAEAGGHCTAHKDKMEKLGNREGCVRKGLEVSGPLYSGWKNCGDLYVTYRESIVEARACAEFGGWWEAVVGSAGRREGSRGLGPV